MAFKLSKKESADRTSFSGELNEAWEELAAAVSKYNDTVSEAKVEVEAAVEKFNGLVTNVKEFTDGVAQRASDEFDDKSEKWQEGERGEAASSWKDEWENFGLEEIDVNWPDDLDIDQPDMDLEALPEEAE